MMHYQAYCSACQFAGDAFGEETEAQAAADRHKKETTHADVVVRPCEPELGDFPLPPDDERPV